MNNDGEHFDPLHTIPFEVEVNLDRYRWVLEHIAGKTVLDLGCGAGLGTYLYSLVAKKVYAIDYDARALEKARQFPFAKDKIEFIHGDILYANLWDVDVDVVVALEILEHFDDPAAVLKTLKAPELIFSVPLYSLETSTFHKFPINSVEDMRNLISPFYDVGDYDVQTHRLLAAKWIRGVGTRYEGSG